ncbi:MAG: ethylbenzene dehydrogenase-related protein [Planctomycetota bacterium]
MKKSTVVIIAIILVGGFLTLVYYGLRYSRGVPVEIEPPRKTVLEVPFVDKEINLSQGISPDIWNSLPATGIEMFYQTMVLPWPEGRVPSATLKAFHNNTDIYFQAQWSDNTENRTLGPGTFSDACGMMFSLEKEAPDSTIMMGFMGKANIWQWKASQDNEYWLKQQPQVTPYADFHYPFEEKELFPVSLVVYESAVSDLMAIRVGTITYKEIQNVQGRGFFDKGIWQVAFKRAMKPHDAETDPSLTPGTQHRCVLAVWNGAKGDRGGRKSISEWVEIVIK